MSSIDGIWRSLVARFVRDEEVAGSNPVIPTTENRLVIHLWIAGLFFCALSLLYRTAILITDRPCISIDKSPKSGHTLPLCLWKCRLPNSVPQGFVVFENARKIDLGFYPAYPASVLKNDNPLPITQKYQPLLLICSFDSREVYRKACNENDPSKNVDGCRPHHC